MYPLPLDGGRCEKIGIRPSPYPLPRGERVNILKYEPLAKVSEKDREKSFPGELERIEYRFLMLRSFGSFVGEGFYPLGI
jgi:hypothetical protein